MKKILLLCLILRSTLIFAQKADPAPFANTITVPQLQEFLTVLTSDSLEGRETGTEGNFKAAQFIARQFEQLGLPKVVNNNSYFQRMVYTNEAWNNIALKVNEQTYRHQFNFYALPGTNPAVKGNTIETTEVIYLGYGIDDKKYSDYKKAGNLTGKVILINPGEPQNKDSICLITKSKSVSSWSTDIKQKLKVA